MRATETERYMRLIALLVEARKRLELKQEQLADALKLDQSTVSRYENRELLLDLELLHAWAGQLELDLGELLAASGYMPARNPADQVLPEPLANRLQSARDDETAYPVGAEPTSDGFNLILRWRDQYFPIPFPGSDIAAYKSAEENISEVFQGLNSTRVARGNRDAIADALQLAISLMPEANPSDIYHHIVYRLYLREYRKTNPKQSWVRAGGEAVELFFKRHYTPLLAPCGISIQIAFETGEKNKFLREMGIADRVPGNSKLDICLYGSTERGMVPFAGVHSKASLAERVSDDKPCSEKMMEHGFKSYLFTLDAKSFPPPTGDLVNCGELGSPSRPSDKRQYIEQHGSFDACLSYNLRTVASHGETRSGKRIYTSKFDKTDAFLKLVQDDWNDWRRANGY